MLNIRKKIRTEEINTKIKLIVLRRLINAPIEVETCLLIKNDCLEEIKVIKIKTKINIIVINLINKKNILFKSCVVIFCIFKYFLYI